MRGIKIGIMHPNCCTKSWHRISEPHEMIDEKISAAQRVLMKDDIHAGNLL